MAEKQIIEDVLYRVGTNQDDGYHEISEDPDGLGLVEISYNCLGETPVCITFGPEEALRIAHYIILTANTLIERDKKETPDD